MMQRNFFTLVALAGVLCCGALYGLWTDRWATAQSTLGASAERLQDVPTTIGEWDGQALEESAEPDRARVRQREHQAAGIAGYLGRRYVSRRDGHTANVFLFSGRPGPMSTHTPDRCYPGAGYRMATAPQKISVAGVGGDEPAELWTADFEKEDAALATRMRAYWAWTNNGSWAVPTYPRLTFGQAPVIYKLYVTHPVSAANRPSDQDPYAEFLRLLLPDIRKAVFSPPNAFLRLGSRAVVIASSIS
jgi:hypothetical protein